MKKFVSFSVALLILGAIAFTPSCKKDDDNKNEPKLIFRYKLDSTQVRLGNLGQPENVPAGNAGQSPVFNTISSHYIELAPNALTALGSGAILYHQQETRLLGF
jgi:hypothetical protein